MSGWQLAQLNVAQLAHDLDHPALLPFVTNLDRLNALAEAAPGFAWRLREESGNATGIRPWGHDTIVNLSVWADVESLRDYTYGGGHVDVLRQRRDFFVPMDTPHLVLWWVPAGHHPSLEEARARLDLLTRGGPSPEAFTLRTAFPAPDGVDARA